MSAKLFEQLHLPGCISSTATVKKTLHTPYFIVLMLETCMIIFCKIHDGPSYCLSALLFSYAIAIYCPSCNADGASSCKYKMVSDASKNLWKYFFVFCKTQIRGLSHGVIFLRQRYPWGYHRITLPQKGCAPL